MLKFFQIEILYNIENLQVNSKQNDKIYWIWSQQKN